MGVQRGEFMSLVQVGKIVACHGRRGFLRVACLSRPASEHLMEVRELYVGNPGCTADRCTVEAARRLRGGMVVKLAGINTGTAAEAFLGMSISLAQNTLPPPGEHEFYYYEIVGFRVRTTGGEEIGTIRETFPTGSNDVWIVVDGTREYLIPVIADVVRTIDRRTHTVTIEPMEGLLDL